MTYRMRPRFHLKYLGSTDSMKADLDRVLQNPDCPCEGELKPNHALLFISQVERRFWSPFVSLEFRESGETGKTEVRGVIGPSPEIWMMFMSGYAFLGFLGFVATMLGIAQIILKRVSWGFYGIPIILVLTICWYGLSYIGKKLAASQIDRLYILLDKAFENKKEENDS